MARASACLEATVDQFLDAFVTHDGSRRSMIGKGTYRLFVVRNESAAKNGEKLGVPNHVLLEAMPSAERMSHADLAKTADMYFSACSRTTAKASILVLRPHRGADDTMDLAARRDVQARAGTDSPIEAILERSPYGMDSGWSRREDATSDRARDVTGIR
jgi:hypothetical protein